jgi:hypothetical protein
VRPAVDAAVVTWQAAGFVEERRIGPFILYRR